MRLKRLTAADATAVSPAQPTEKRKNPAPKPKKQPKAKLPPSMRGWIS